MDASVATAVILIFVLSIISGVTGSGPRVNPSNIVKPIPKQAKAPASPSAPVFPVSGAPAPHYAGGHKITIKEDITVFIQKKNKKVKVWDASVMAEAIVRHSKKFNVNPRLLTAVIARESRFNRYAVSSSGAQGLGQLLPSTARGLGVSNSFDIEENIRGTTRYVRSMLDRFKSYGSRQVQFALAGYKEGPNAVKRKGSYSSGTKRYIVDIFKYHNEI